MAVLGILVGASGLAAAQASWLSVSPVAPSGTVQAGALGAAAAPTAQQVVGGRTVALSWTAVALADRYEVLHHDTATGPGTVVCSTTSLSCTDPTPRSGTHWYSVVGRLGGAWVSGSPRTAYTADSATTVTVGALGTDTGSSATDGITSAASTTLTGTGEPGATVVVRRGGTTLATATVGAGGSWTTAALTLVEGSQVLDATATDVYGNTTTASRTVQLDTVAPTVTVGGTCATPGTAGWCRQTSLSVSATFADAGSGLAAAGETRIDAGAWTTYSGAVSVGEGAARVVAARATDVAGNIGTASATYDLDGTAPVLSGTTPGDGTSLSLALLGQLLGTTCGGDSACGQAADATSGLASASASVGWKLQRGSSCYVVGAGWTTCTGYAFQSATGTLPQWRAGVQNVYSVLSSYTLTVRATDRAGNVVTQTVSFSTLL